MVEKKELIKETEKGINKEIKITPIVEGISIDHITAGKALEVAKILFPSELTATPLVSEPE